MDSKITAAVLIPFILGEEGSRILFEKRALNLSRQPGDICFPGGMIEPGESPAETALRECCEELLISRDMIKNLWEAGVERGPAGRAISLFTCELKNYAGTFNKAEVDRVFTAPVREFLEPKEAYDYEGFHIWGFTARAICHIAPIIEEYAES